MITTRFILLLSVPALMLAATAVAYDPGFASPGYDFNDCMLPSGTSFPGAGNVGRIADDGTGSNCVVHLTDANQGGAFGVFSIPAPAGGSNVDNIHLHWRSLVGGDNGSVCTATQFGRPGADGYSMSWGTDLPNPPSYGNPGEEGAGTGLIVTVDTFDNGGGEAPGLEIKWRGARVAFDNINADQGLAKDFLRKGVFVEADLSVDTAGHATFTYDGRVLTATLADWTGIPGGGCIMFGARSGGACDNHWIDELLIEKFIGALDSEIDLFPYSLATARLQFPDGRIETVTLAGRMSVQTFIPPDGTAADTDGDGLDEAPTDMRMLDLSGMSSTGPVAIRIDPSRLSNGRIQERDIATGAALGWLDLELFAINQLTQIGIKDGVVGFTLNTTATNVGLNRVPWNFPVNETMDDPWVAANKFTGQEGGSFNHAHFAGLSPFPVEGGPPHPRSSVGRHPHLQFYLYRQPPSGGPGTTVRIGQSDLKHTYLFGPPPLHVARVCDPAHPEINCVDSYTTAHNQDQSFYGPVSEMDPITFKVAAHDHMASLHPELGPGYWRDHGEPAFLGGGDFAPDAGHPGADNIDHLLRAPLDLMIPPETGPQPRWFLAGVYFVVGDMNPANNSRWVEIFPHWSGSRLTFTEGMGGSNLNTIPDVRPPYTLKPGLLDLPPFARGTADSHFDMFYEVRIGQQVFHTAEAVRIETIITYKPAGEGERYASSTPADLLDSSGNLSGIRLLEITQTPDPEKEVDEFPRTQAQLTLTLPNGRDEIVTLAGPMTARVCLPHDGQAADTDANGRDQTPSEISSLYLRGNSSLGEVQVRLAPGRLSRGQIEETSNNIPGVLEVPPFATAGTADSTFEVWFEVVVGGQVYHAAQPAQMQALISQIPPAESEMYVNSSAQPIDLLDEDGNATGFRLVREIHVPNPQLEVDVFPVSFAQMTLQTADGRTETVNLAGRTTVEVAISPTGQAVDLDSNGLDQAPAEIVHVDLRGMSSFGPINIWLDPRHAARGQIEEQSNSTPGMLEVPPFTAAGSATSSFQVWFAVQMGGPTGQVLYASQPARMQAALTHKPPSEGEAYFSAEPIDLMDTNGNPTGLRLIGEAHILHPVKEIDTFSSSLAEFTLQWPGGATETVILSGPTTVHVYVPPTGQAADADWNGLDQAATEMVQLDLSGNSSMGPVSVRLRPDIPTVGQIEERMNVTPGLLDFPPFTSTGTADSFFDIWLEVSIGDQLFHLFAPITMRALISHKPPAPGETYTNMMAEPMELLNTNGNRTGIFLVNEVHTPNPPEQPPKLEIALLADGHVRICWPYPSTGFVLQCRPRLEPDSANWELVPAPVEIRDGKKCVTVEASELRRFFRLNKPSP